MFHNDQETLSLLDRYPKQGKAIKAKSSKQKTIIPKGAKKPRKTTIATKPRKTFYVLKVLLGGLFCVVLGLGIFYTVNHVMYDNPLLGRWRAQTVLGIIEIEFDQHNMYSFGTKNPVTYDVLDGKVIVIDNTIKVGNTYKIIDKSTISLETGASKIIYRRVK